MKQFNNLYLEFDDQLNLKECSDDMLCFLNIKNSNDLSDFFYKLYSNNQQTLAPLQKTWQEQDKMALQGNTIRTLDAHNYPHGFSILVGRKAPLKSASGKIIGIEAYAHFWDNPLAFEIEGLMKRNDLWTNQESLDNLLRFQGRHVFKGLSNREAECLRYIASGYTYAMMAECMFISIRTVETHIQKIKNKLGIDNKKELIAFYHSKGS